jgi:hypothetical protein
MSQKNDYLKECMSTFGTVPIDAFNQSYCRVCAARDCSRSRANNFLFDNRVANWEDSLFNKVPRASENDPIFKEISSKRFLPTMDTINIRSDQLPPRFMGVAPTAETVPGQAPASVQVQAPAPAQAQSLAPVPVPSLNPAPIQAPGISSENTPFIQGTLLKRPESEVIMVPGQSYTFGSNE